MTLSSTEDGYAECTAVIRNEEGLHMRPAMRFVDCANSFQSQISVAKADMSVDGKSIMQITTLAAGKGVELKISARGHDARQAVRALADLVENEMSSEK